MKTKQILMRDEWRRSLGWNNRHGPNSENFYFFLRLPVRWDDRSETDFLHIYYVSDFGLRLKFNTLVSAKDKLIELWS